jgi:membrane fusion protein (multidrug efflux system)
MSEIRKRAAEGRAQAVTEFPQQSALPPAAADAPVRDIVKRRSRMQRPLLLFGVPLLVVVAACLLYLHGGRYVDTNNAYVKANKAIIAAEVTGKVVEVAVKDNDHVDRGQLLFRLENTPYQLILERAEAALAQTSQDVAAMKLLYRQAIAEVELAQNNVAYSRVTYNRQVGLVDRKIGSISDLDDARHNLDTASKQQELASQRAAKILVDLNGDADIAVTAHPRYLQAKSMRDQAALDLQRTLVTAPFPGIASRKPEVGAYVERGNPVMSLVSDGDMWIEANFKETDLTFLRPNQSVEVHIDTYPGIRWRGTVQSLSEATGSEFALLPAQNATGNWVKVVQRVAVRITLDRGPDDLPLRAGMSATVKVDTGHTRGLHDLLPD